MISTSLVTPNTGTDYETTRRSSTDYNVLCNARFVEEQILRKFGITLGNYNKFVSLARKCWQWFQLSRLQKLHPLFQKYPPLTAGIWNLKRKCSCRRAFCFGKRPWQWGCATWPVFMARARTGVNTCLGTWHSSGQHFRYWHSRNIWLKSDSTSDVFGVLIWQGRKGICIPLLLGSVYGISP